MRYSIWQYNYCSNSFNCKLKILHQLFTMFVQQGGLIQLENKITFKELGKAIKQCELSGC